MKKNIFKTLFKVILLFIVFELVIQIIGGFFASSIFRSLKYGKYGVYYLSEFVVFLICLVILIIRKRTYIFKNKKLDFKKSIKLCMPILVISIFLLISNSIGLIGSKVDFLDLFSLILYVIFIGLFEEIFFRGIILEEFLSDYHNSKKEVLFSIILSALIFGSLHITNMLAGQDLLTTSMQVIQTTSIGVLFGAVYYLTRNIWALAFIHGFYDFSVLLGMVNDIKDCGFVLGVPFSITLSSLIASLMLSLIYLIYSRGILNKTNFNKALGHYVTLEDKNEDAKIKRETRASIFIIIGIWGAFSVCYSLFLGDDLEKYYKCYEYEEKVISKYETHYYSYNNFTITLNNMYYEVYIEDGNVNLKAYDKNEVYTLKQNINSILVVDKKLVLYADEEVYYYDYSLVNNIEELKKGEVVLELPDITGGGYLLDATTNTRYPLVRDIHDKKFIIDDSKLVLVK